MSITAVPLRPVSKGGIALLWIGLIALVLGAAAYAMTVSHVPTIGLDVVRAGTGRFPTDTDYAIIKYEGKLANGTGFDANSATPFPVSGVIPGFTMGLKRMQVGGKYVLRIPSELGYGAEERGPIPANSDLTFDIEVLDLKTEAEVQAIVQQQQAMQQMMQQQGGGAGGPPPGAPGGPPGGM